MEFFNGMEPLLKTFWFIAIPATLIFLVQTVLTFVGADATDGLEADFDSNLSGAEAPFQLFSLRNMVNLLLGIGWTGIAFYSSINSKGLLIGLSVLVGVLFVLVFFLLIRQLQKLGEDNTFNIQKTLQQTGTVYLTIPEQKSGFGKVQVSVHGAVHEINAITEKEKLPSGSMVRIVKIESNNLVLVEKL